MLDQVAEMITAGLEIPILIELAYAGESNRLAASHCSAVQRSGTADGKSG